MILSVSFLSRLSFPFILSSLSCLRLYEVIELRLCFDHEADNQCAYTDRTHTWSRDIRGILSNSTDDMFSWISSSLSFALFILHFSFRFLFLVNPFPLPLYPSSQPVTTRSRLWEGVRQWCLCTCVYLGWYYLGRYYLGWCHNGNTLFSNDVDPVSRSLLLPFLSGLFWSGWRTIS